MVSPGVQSSLQISLTRCQDALANVKHELATVKVDNRIRRIKYVFLTGQRRLQRAMDALQQELASIDQLCRPLFLASRLDESLLAPSAFKIVGESLTTDPYSRVPMSDLKIVSATHRSGENRVCGHYFIEEKEKWNDLEFLCTKLRDGNGRPGIPACIGYRQPIHNRQDAPWVPIYQLVFEVPVDEPYYSLAHYICTQNIPSLAERLHLCIKLAQALESVHNLDIVHKSIRPHAIIIAEGIFLMDWTYARGVADATSRCGNDGSWTRNIYQHPKRQTTKDFIADAEYVPKHDLYSLGVVMLEVLLWEPFIIDENKICALFEWTGLMLGEEQGGLPGRYAGKAEKLASRPNATCAVWRAIASQELVKRNDSNSQLSQLILDCLEENFDSASQIITTVETLVVS